MYIFNFIMRLTMKQVTYKPGDQKQTKSLR